MCDNTLLNVRLRDDAGTKRLTRAPEPRPFRLVGEEGTLYCRGIPPFRVGDTRYFELGILCCDCGAWDAFLPVSNYGAVSDGPRNRELSQGLFLTQRSGNPEDRGTEAPPTERAAARPFL